jgi:hypothetical protein
MIKEPRLMVRLIALWVIFILVLLFTFWYFGTFVNSVVKMASGGYDSFYSYDSSSSTTCLQSPTYPTTLPSSSEEMDAKDKAVVDKYEKDLEQYNKNYSALCQADQEKQKAITDKEERVAEKQNRSFGISDIASNAALFLLGLVLLLLSMKEIKRVEQIT